jgi:transcriptional regulator with XRE-family HTH domain
LSSAERGPSPGAARRQLGVLLKRLRDAAGLRLSDAGRTLDRSSATMSRIENGRLAPRVIEVTALLDLYGRFNAIPDDVRERALELAGDARKEAWYSPFRDVLTGSLTPDHIERLIEFETDAEEMWSYEVEFVPGLLQTAAYARVVTEMFYPDSTERERSRFVDFRLARQRQLTAGSQRLRLRSVVRETAVRRVLGPATVMLEQLEQLAVDLRNGNPHVNIRIVPDALALPQAMRGAFVLMRFVGADRNGLVYIEGREGADYLQNQVAVERYGNDFEALWNASLSQAESLRLIESIAGSLS